MLNENYQTNGKSCECPSLIIDVFFQQKKFDDFEIAKTYQDYGRFAQDFWWITIMINSISDSNFIKNLLNIMADITYFIVFLIFEISGKKS